MQVGFLTWDMDVPERMITQSVPYRPSTQLNEQQEGHFELVNHQLLQVRHALAISKVCSHHTFGGTHHMCCFQLNLLRYHCNT